MANLSLAVCTIMTAAQTYAMPMKFGEHRSAAMGDADYICIIQSAVIQYIGLYLKLARPRQRR